MKSCHSCTRVFRVMPNFHPQPDATPNPKPCGHAFAADGSEFMRVLHVGRTGYVGLRVMYGVEGLVLCGTVRVPWKPPTIL